MFFLKGSYLPINLYVVSVEFVARNIGYYVLSVAIKSKKTANQHSDANWQFIPRIQISFHSYQNFIIERPLGWSRLECVHR